MSQNILLLSNAYFPSIGGIENSLRHLAQEALKNSHTVKIIVSDIGVDENSENRLRDIVDGVEVERYPLRPYKGKLLSAFNLFYSNFILYQKLRELYSKDPRSIVIARFHFTALMASFAGFEQIRYLVPSIVKNQLGVESNQGFFNKIKRFIRVWLNNRVQKSALLRCRNYVFSNSMLKQCINLADNEESTYNVTKPGVDSNRFYPLSPVKKAALKDKLGIPQEKPIILFVGRFVKAKGADLLLEALSKIKMDCHLVLVGEGKEETNYKILISKLKLTDKVTFFPPTREVEAFYQMSDIFAMTSNYEPLGQTILEAFSSGLALVAFKSSKTVDTATQELGMDDYISYSKDHSIVALVDSIESAIRCPIDTTTVHQQVIDKFNWARLFSDLINIK